MQFSAPTEQPASAFEASGTVASGRPASWTVLDTDPELLPEGDPGPVPVVEAETLAELVTEPELLPEPELPVEAVPDPLPVDPVQPVQLPRPWPLGSQTWTPVPPPGHVQPTW